MIHERFCCDVFFIVSVVDYSLALFFVFSSLFLAVCSLMFGCFMNLLEFHLCSSWPVGCFARLLRSYENSKNFGKCRKFLRLSHVALLLPSIFPLFSASPRACIIGGYSNTSLSFHTKLSHTGFLLLSIEVCFRSKFFVRAVLTCFHQYLFRCT